MYDHVFYYREKNKQDLKNIGCNNTSLLRSSYVKENNFPIQEVANSPYACDVIFIGHYEADGRDQAILNILNSGINFKLFGTGWNASPLFKEIEQKLGYNIKPLYQEDYNLALNSAQIALVFLSKINNDTYTRRCFEIPATGTCMLAEYSDDLSQNLYTENEEAFYFRSFEELPEKIIELLKDSKETQRVSRNGLKKLKEAGHEVRDRAEQIVKIAKQ